MLHLRIPPAVACDVFAEGGLQPERPVSTAAALENGVAVMHPDLALVVPGLSLFELGQDIVRPDSSAVAAERLF